MLDHFLVKEMRDVCSQTSENALSDDNSNEDLPDSLQQDNTMSVHSAGNHKEVTNDVDLLSDNDNTQNMMFEVESEDQYTHSVIDELEFTQQNNFDILSPLDIDDDIASKNVPLNNIAQFDPNF